MKVSQPGGGGPSRGHQFSSVAPKGAKPGRLGGEGALSGHLVPRLSENALYEPCLYHSASGISLRHGMARPCAADSSEKKRPVGSEKLLSGVTTGISTCAWEDMLKPVPGACGRVDGGSPDSARPHVWREGWPRGRPSLSPSREEQGHSRGSGQFSSRRAGRAVTETGGAADHHL